MADHVDPQEKTSFQCSKFPRPPDLHLVCELNAKLVEPNLDLDLVGATERQIRAAWALLLREITESNEVGFGVTAERTSISLGRESIRAVYAKVEPGGSLSALVEGVKTTHIGASLMYHNILMVRQETKHGIERPSIDELISTGQCVNLSLVLDCVIVTSGVEFYAHYDNRVVTKDDVAWILYHLQHLLFTITHEPPHILIKDIFMFGPKDMEQMEYWNAETPSYVDGCVHDVVLEQIRKRPNQVAIHAWDGSFTYKELGEFSALVATRLATSGVGPEILVPFCFEKSKWTPVAMLGILKAGGACVAVDPSHPIDRLKIILADAKADLAISSTKHSPFMSDLVRELVILDYDALIGMGKLQKENIPEQTSANNPAFVYFTSGSTGTPKGIVIEHGAFCSSVRSHAPALGLTEKSRSLQFAAHTYDVSVGEIFSTLMVGGTVCVPSDEDRLNDLAACIDKLRVNWSFLTPTVASTITPSQVPSLRTLLLGGEHATTDNISTWAGGNVCLINSYGPAECSIWTTRRYNVPVGADPAIMGHRVGCKMWVVSENDHDMLCPIGCAGELLIEGPLLGRGYLNDDKKTKASFIRDPLWSRTTTESRRFYKSGDIVRYNSDGSISFVRRKDTQVKVRGQRIELGEVEVHMSGSHLIQQAIGSVPRSGPFAHRLVAVMTLSNIAAPDQAMPYIRIIPKTYYGHAAAAIAEMRNRVAVKLPSYMVPTIWVVLQTLPRLTSGKTNRKDVVTWLENLTEAERSQIAHISVANSKIQEVLPLTETESLLRKIWSRVLNVPEHNITQQQQFLTLGGDSISAMQVATRCRSHGMDVTVVDVLRSSTISGLAKVIRKLSPTTDAESHQTEVNDIPLPLSPMQRMFFELEPDGNNHFNQGFLLEIRHNADELRINRALHAIVSHHAMLRARFIQISGQWCQVVTSNIKNSYHFTKEFIKSSSDAEACTIKTEQMLDIRDGPIMAGNLFETRTGEKLLFLTAHHLVVDLVSWRIVLEDLEDLLRNDRSTLLRPKPLTFTSWSQMVCEFGELQACVNQHEQQHADFAYWALSPIDNRWGDAIESTAELDLDCSKAILDGECHTALGTETVEILLASVAHAFSMLFPDRSAPLIFNEGHGREQIGHNFTDLSQTVGWFTSIYPISTQIDHAYDIHEIVRRTKDARRRIANNGLTYMASQYGSEQSRQCEPTQMEILFNYTGRYQQFERADSVLTQRSGGARESCGPNSRRFSLLEITASVLDGHLCLNVVYNQRMMHQDRLSCFAETCVLSLQEAVMRLRHAPRQLTLADFPSLQLTYDELDGLMYSCLPELGITTNDDLEDIYPCTAMQAGMIASQRMTTSLYQVHELWKIDSVDGTRPSLDRLHRAWQQVVDHHAILRTVFLEGICKDELYTQAVLRNVEARVSTIELKSLQDLRELQSHYAADFKLGQSLHYLTICQLHSGDVYVRLEINHAITDGFSAAILRRDIAQAYDDQLAEQVKPLYSAYVNHRSSTSAHDYWVRQLRDAESCLFPLLNDDAQKAERVLQTQHVKLDVSPAEVHDICKANNITVAHFCQTAWAVLLQSYSGVANVCFGVMLSGRNARIDLIEDIAGPMIRILPFIISVSSSTKVNRLLAQVASVSLDMLSNHDYSLNEVQRVSGLGGERLFNTAMSFQTSSTLAVRESSIRITDEGCYDPTEFALFLNILDGGLSEGLDVSFNYWNDHISSRQAANISSTLARTMRLLVSSLDCSVGSLDLVSEKNMKDISSWNAHQPKLFKSCIPEVIEERVAERPHDVAICGWDGQLTFWDLDDLSTRLAGHIRALLDDRAKHSLIPFAFSKSIWVPVTMLAILKAGAACVAVDPTHPQTRIEKIAKDAGAPFIITTPEHLDKIRSIASCVVVTASFVHDLPAVNLNKGAVESQDPAFVIFTSGSTGTPKGIVISHESMCTSARAHGDVMELRPGTRVLQFAAHTFDVSLQDIFSTLMHGGCVCIPSEKQRLEDVVGFINHMRVNWAFLTPTMASLIKPSDVPTLKTLTLGGEAIRKTNVEVWGGEVRLLNSFGPAECSICCAVSPLLGKDCNPNNFGKALPSALLWVVSPHSHDRLAPVGAIGELLIEGPILATGYLNDEQRTREAFIKDTVWALEMSPTRSRRFYKTGDLVRYNSSGQLTFIGRRDGQIKVRGQRIETGEIEFQLSTASQARASMVTLPTSGSYNKLLVAVLSLTNEEVKSDGKTDITLADKDDFSRGKQLVESTRRHLMQNLPSFMVPTVWVVVGSIPLLTSGKTNRAAVKWWLEYLDPLEIDFIARMNDEIEGNSHDPCNEIEQQRQNVWSDVLNVAQSKVTRNRTFFSLGGDSISAMQVMSRLKTVGLEVSMQDLLRSQTIERLARCVRAPNRLPQASDTSLDINPGASSFLSPIQQLFVNLEAPSVSHFNQSILLRLKSRVQEDAVSRALEQLVKRHGMLRARFEQLNSIWTQKTVDYTAGSFTLSKHLLNDLHVSSLEPRILHTQKSLDIERGPVFAAQLFSLTDERDDQVLFLTAHHLVTDLVSWRIMLHDLEQFLVDPDALMHQSTSLPFCAWTTLQAQHVSRTPPSATLHMPVVLESTSSEYWGLCGSTSNFYEDTIDAVTILDRDITEAILGSCNNALDTEPIDIMLSILVHSFITAFPDRSPPSVINEGHGRETWSPDIDISETVGWFTTFTPTSGSELPKTSDLVSVLGRIKDCRRRMPRNGCDYFASLVQDLNLSRLPDIEILVNYIGRTQQLEREDGLFSDMSWGGLDATESDSKTRRMAIIEVVISVNHDRLHWCFQYNRRMKHQPELTRWISTLTESASIAVQTLKDMDRQLTLQDFPKSTFSYDDFQTFLLERGRYLEDLKNLEGLYPGSPMQQGLMLSQTVNNGLYRVLMLFRITGTEPDIPRLLDSWRRVVDRHQMLRCVIAGSSALTGLWELAVFREAKTRCYFKKGDPFMEMEFLKKALVPELGSERRPQHSFGVLKDREENYFCLLDINHMFVDGYSTSVLIRDLERAYMGTLPTGPKPSFSAVLHHAHLQPKSEAQSYWQEYLSGVEPCHFPTKSNPHGLGKLQTAPVFSWDTDLFRVFSTKYSFTVANIVYLAWAVLLDSYIGSRSTNSGCCFGYLFSGRNVPVADIEDVVGPLINILVCRVDLSDRTKSIIELLMSVQDSITNSLPYHHCPLGEVEHGLKLRGTHLFNTAVSVQKSPVQLGGPIQFDFAGGEDPSEYDLVLNVIDGGQTVTASLEHWSGKVSQASAIRIASTLSTIITQIVSDPGRAIGEIHLISARDREQIMDWNGPEPTCRQEIIHDVIHEYALSSPTAPAICSWDAELSFRELDELSSLLSEEILEERSGGQAFVLTLFQKSAWAIAASLGVLKAGLAFVPLEPSHPRERLKAITMQTNAHVILCSLETMQLAATLAPRVIVVARDKIESTTRKGHNGLVGTVSAKPSPDDAAYVMFTSGSTGTPKGVVITHSAFSTNILEHGSRFRFASSTRTLQYSAYVFDASIMEIFTCLAFGGCVCVPSDQERVDDISAVIERWQVNWMFATPSFLRTIDAHTTPSLRTIALGGEMIAPELLRRWQPHATVIQCYGPTEATVICSMVDPEIDAAEKVSIGRAVGSINWIVDPENIHRLTPVGAVGELLIEGPTLAKGYLHDEARTSEVFVQPPAWARSLQRLGDRRFYKSGDLVRYEPDSDCMTFVSRKDVQMKIHGQRIEAAEIETALTSEAVIRNAACFVPSNGLLAHKVIAVLSFQGGKNQSNDQSDIRLARSTDNRPQAQIVDNLRSGLSQKLPSYAIPSSWIILEHLPSSVSGKIDRRGLLHWVESINLDTLRDIQRLTTHEVTSFRKKSPMEERLWSIAQEILNMDPDAEWAHQSFARLGGDSITAMQFAARARQQGFVIAVKDILITKDLSQLGSHLVPARESGITMKPSTSPRTETPSSRCNDHMVSTKLAGLELDVPALAQFLTERLLPLRIDPQTVEDAYPCVPMQQSILVSQTMNPKLYIVRSLWEMNMSVDVSRLLRAWHKVVQGHTILRTVFVESISSDPQRIFDQVVLRDVHARISKVTCDRSFLERLARGDEEKSTSLSNVRNHHLTICQVDDGSRYCLWEFSHAIVDGASIAIMMTDLDEAYRSDNRDSPPKPSFGAFARYQRSLFSAHPSSIGFWKSRLQAAEPCMFPPQKPENLKIDARHDVLKTTDIIMPSGASSALRKFCQSNDTTVANFFQVVWIVVLALYVQTDDVSFGYMTSGRDVPVDEVETIMGPFVNILTSHTRINPQMSILDLLYQCRQLYLESLDHQHVPSAEIQGVIGRKLFNTVLSVQKQSAKNNTLLTETGGKDPTEFDICVNVLDGTHRISASFNYWQGLMAEDGADSLSSLISTVISLMLSAPAQKLEELMTCDAAVNGRRPQRRTRWIDKIHNTALKHSEAIAVQGWDLSIKYGDLMAKSLALSIHMTQRVTESRICAAIIVVPSAIGLLALLTTLNSADSCIMIDPSMPVAEMEEVLIKYEVNVVLTSRDHQGIAARLGNAVEIILLNPSLLLQLSTVASEGAKEAYERRNTELRICTGDKDLLHEVRLSRLERHATLQAAAMQMNPKTRYLQYTRWTSEAALCELAALLSSGGCLCIASPAKSLPKAVEQSLRVDRITHLCLSEDLSGKLEQSQLERASVLGLIQDTRADVSANRWKDQFDIILAVNQCEPPTWKVIAKTTQSNDQSLKEKASDVEVQLREIWSKVLNVHVSYVGLESLWTSLGGDSISAMQVVSHCRNEGLVISVADIFQARTVTQLAQKVRKVVSPLLSTSIEPLMRDFALSPVQRLFFDSNSPEPNHFNQSFLLKVDRRVSSQDVDSALQSLVDKHTMLRARFTQSDGVRQQHITNDVAGSYALHVTQLSKTVDLARMIQVYQRSLDIQNGPLLAAVFADVSGESYLFITAHHLVIDLVSWRIILADLEHIFTAPELFNNKKPMAFQTWLEFQNEYVSSKKPEEVLPFPVSECNTCYWGMDHTPNIMADEVQLDFVLDSPSTLALLGSANDALGTELVELLLATSIWSFSRVFEDRSPPTIFNEGHGRESWDTAIDLSETCGWFTVMSPISPGLRGGESLVETIRCVKDNRRFVPNNGWEYFTSRYCNTKCLPVFQSHSQMEFLFNYLGRYQQLEREDSLFSLFDLQSLLSKDQQNELSDCSAQTPRLALFEASAIIEGGELKVQLTYNDKMAHGHKIQEWMGIWKQSLTEAAALADKGRTAFTLSDFPLLDTTYNKLDTLVRETLPHMGISDLDRIEDIYPCSPLQRDLIMSQSKSPELYNVQSTWKVESSPEPLDVSRLEQAWENVCARHSILRTVLVQGLAKQQLDFSQLVLKHAGKRSIVQTRAAISQLSNIAGTKIPVSYRDNTPPNRLFLTVLDNGEIYMTIAINHILIDGTSMSIILRDLQRSYNGILPHINAPQYRDFVAHVENSSMGSPLDFWVSYLQGMEPCIFPTLNNGQEGGDLQSVSIELPPLHALQKAVAQAGVTLNNLFQTAWALVLQAYTGMENIAFGYLTSGRDISIPNCQEIVGPLISMLFSRASLSGSTTLRNVMETMNRDYIDGLPHQHCSQAAIYHEFGRSGTRLFNTVMSLQRPNTTEKSPTYSPCFEPYTAHEPTDYDITVNIQVLSNQASIALTYWSSVMSREQAEIIASSFGAIVSQIVSGPDTQISDVTLLDSQQKSAMMRRATEPQLGVKACVQELFNERARASPDSQAVTSHDGTLTYGDLNRMSSAVAHRLRSLGVRSNMIIPIVFEKSVLYPVAIMAVLKSGGAFCLFDPSQPGKRLQHILSVTGAKLIVCSPLYEEMCLSYSQTVIALDRDMLTKSESPIVNPPKGDPESLCYAIFTSGTTGQPKGIEIEHSAFCASSTRHAKALNITQNSRVLQFASFSFDASILETLTTLIHGGCICVPSEYDRLHNLPSVISSMRVNWALLTPSFIRLFEPHQLQGLEDLALGGEAMNGKDAATWTSRLRLYNAYGPSECSVVATVNPHVNESEASNIGWTVSNPCLVVNPRNHDNVMPIGAVGELLITGPTLARGYLGREEETALAFVQSSTFLGVERAYRTGDFVRQHLDGSFTYLGRMDSQVKVNGQRIELDEVDFHLNKSIGGDGQLAGAASVIPRGNDVLLAAFVWPTANVQKENGETAVEVVPMTCSGLTDSMQNLRMDLADNLPSHLVPSICFALSHAPLNSAGKLDRKMLQKLCQALTEEEWKQRLSSATDNRAPETQKEKDLQSLWSTILSVSPDSIHAHDGFFHRGGDSMSAIRLAASARDEGISLTVPQIFEHPTLQAMAHISMYMDDCPSDNLQPFSLIALSMDVKQARKLAAVECEVPGRLVEDIYPCTPLQKALMQASVRGNGAYLTRHIFQIKTGFDLDRLRAALTVVSQSLPILRTRIITDRAFGELQVITRMAPDWGEHDDLAEYLEWDVRFGGPLSRFSVVEQDDKQFIVWTVHHAVYDGWTIRMIYSAVDKVYRGQELDMIPSFASFVNFLIQRNVEEEHSFWKSQLHQCTAPSFPSLPEVSFDSRPDSVAQHIIDTPSSMEGITAATILQAAWALCLSRYLKENDVVFGLTLSGRETPMRGIIQVAGPTVATIPCRIRILKETTVGEFLSEVQSSSAATMPYIHAGLNNIAGAGESACSFQNILVIQPEETQSSSCSILDTLSVSMNQEAFFNIALVLSCELGRKQTTVRADFDSRVTSSDHIKVLLHQFEHAVRQLIGESSVQIHQLDPISPYDRSVLSQWNATSLRTINSCVYDQICKNAQACPDTVAISSWDRDVTYGELDAISSRMAVRLRAFGVSSGAIVPYAFPKSSVAVISQMAILKAGGACVCVDLSYPDERLARIFVEASANLTVCTPSMGQRMRNFGIGVVEVDWHYLDHLGVPNSLPDWEVNPLDPAFVVFTSGSTGVPKGIVLSHSNIASSAYYHGPALGINKESRVLQFSTYVFDAAIAEIFTTLTAGGCVCIPSELERINDLAGAIDRLAATWAFLTPTLATLIHPNDVPSLKVLNIGGEAMRRENIEIWGTRLCLINSYGPSETTIYSSCNKPVKLEKDRMNIGHPFGCHYWIVDSENYHHLAPIGCVGELVIQGPIVTQGYLNKPELTRVAFIEPPQWTAKFDFLDQSQRFYKTGDLAKFNDDGTVTYCARRDTQVKLRSQRIELEEVEYHLRRVSPSTWNSTVETICPASRNNAPVLAAFFDIQHPDHCETSKLDDSSGGYLDSPEPGSIAVRAALLKILPAYMVPSLYIKVKRLPLTTSGKTDRSRLRQVGENMEAMQLMHYEAVSGASKQDESPLTLVEMALADVWAQILPHLTTSVSRKDHFFQLGGDSISAMRLVDLARKRSLNLTVQDVFAAPGLQEMAQICNRPYDKVPSDSVASDTLRQQKREQPSSRFVPDLTHLGGQFESANVEAIVPASDYQAWTLSIGSMQEDGFNNVFNLDFSSDVDVHDIHRACTAWVRHHPILRTVFVGVKDAMYQVKPFSFELPQFRSRIIDCQLSTPIHITFESFSSSPSPP